MNLRVCYSNAIRLNSDNPGNKGVGNEMNDNNEILWKKLREGDQQALEQLFLYNYSLLYDYGFKICRDNELVKDHIQELFAYIWEKRTSLSDVESVKSYLLVSFRRKILTALKRSRRKYAIHRYFADEQDWVEFSVEKDLIISEQQKQKNNQLNKAFNSLPPRLLEALYLKIYSGLKYSEIAPVMEISEQVARNYVSEAIQRLRTLLA